MQRITAAARPERPQVINTWHALVAAAWLLLFLISSVASAQMDMQPSSRAKAIPRDLPADEAAVARLYLEVLPAVVAVYGETDRATELGIETTRSHGGGVVVAADGQVLTAAHVLDGKERVLVRTQDGVEHAATLVEVDRDSDLALVQMAEPVPDLPVATLGDSDQLAVGQRVIVIGSPFGLVNSLSVGRISGFRESAAEDANGDTPAVEFIQTDAAINLGNSGGPLFDSGGRLVAIASSYWTAGSGSGGVGFAATINTATERLRDSTQQAHRGATTSGEPLPHPWGTVSESLATYPRNDSN